MYMHDLYTTCRPSHHHNGFTRTGAYKYIIYIYYAYIHTYCKNSSSLFKYLEKIRNKIEILTNPNPEELLNKRSEIMPRLSVSKKIFTEQL